MNVAVGRSIGGIMRAFHSRLHRSCHWVRGRVSNGMAILLLLASLSVTGCYSFENGSDSNFADRFFSGWRDEVWAKRAYRLRYPTCQSRHPTHFQQGFIAGYCAICCGDDAYTPALPPRNYWGYSYQSAQGQEMIDAWFSGYPAGVKAAQQDGAGKYRDVQVSRMVDAALRPNDDVWNQYSPTSGESDVAVPLPMPNSEGSEGGSSTPPPVGIPSEPMSSWQDAPTLPNLAPNNTPLPAHATSWPLQQ